MPLLDPWGLPPTGIRYGMCARLFVPTFMAKSTSPLTAPGDITTTRLDRRRIIPKSAQNCSESLCAGLWVLCRIFGAWFGFVLIQLRFEIEDSRPDPYKFSRPLWLSRDYLLAERADCAWHQHGFKMGTRVVLGRPRKVNSPGTLDRSIEVQA